MGGVYQQVMWLPLKKSFNDLLKQLPHLQNVLGNINIKSDVNNGHYSVAIIAEMWFFLLISQSFTDSLRISNARMNK